VCCRISRDFGRGSEEEKFGLIQGKIRNDGKDGKEKGKFRRTKKRKGNAFDPICVAMYLTDSKRFSSWELLADEVPRCRRRKQHHTANCHWNLSS